jgi:hypothetical protein
MRDCGCLEPILVREWAQEAVPEPASVAAINRLAELPQLIKERLAVGLEAIHVGAGGVPDLDHMGELKGMMLPSGRATWDACAGAYGDRKIIVGSRPSPTPDVMCHEIGHALDDLDGREGTWQSDSAEFCDLYQRCLSPPGRPAGAPGVLRGRVRRDSLGPAPGAGRDAGGRHQGGPGRHALLQRALRHLKRSMQRCS